MRKEGSQEISKEDKKEGRKPRKEVKEGRIEGSQGRKPREGGWKRGRKEGYLRRNVDGRKRRTRNDAKEGRMEAKEGRNGHTSLFIRNDAYKVLSFSMGESADIT